MADLHEIELQDIYAIVSSYFPRQQSLAMLDDLLLYKLNNHFPSPTKRAACSLITSRIYNSAISLMANEKKVASRLDFSLPLYDSLCYNTAEEFACTCASVLETVLLSIAVLGFDDKMVSTRLIDLSLNLRLGDILIEHMYKPSNKRTPDANRRLVHFLCIKLITTKGVK